MRVHFSFVAASAIAIGALTLPTRAQDQSQPNAADKAGQAIGNAAQKTGDAAKGAVDKTEQAVGLEASDNPEKNVGNIQGKVAEVTQAAATKSGVDDIVERLSKADRDRINQNKDALKNTEALDGRIDQFQKDWKAKYNQDFKIPDKAAVYNEQFGMITQGAEARTAGATVPPGDEKKMDRDFAVLKIPASHGKPALSVPLVFEGTSWKIDAPDTLDANKLRDNIQTALTKADESKDQWPSDVNDAYRSVSHGILAAVMDQPQEGQAQPAAGQLPADQGTAPAGQQPAQPAPGQQK
jgi:hypothetical protein